MEIAPWKEEHVNAAGKCQAVWKRFVMNGTIIKGEVGSGVGKTHIWARRTTDAPGNGKIIMIYQPQQGWTINETIDLYEPGMNKEELRSALMSD